MALSVLADAVLRVATRLKAPVIDLRRVMNKALGADGDRWRTHASRVTLWIAVFQSCCAHAAILDECFNLMSTNVTAFKLDLDRLFSHSFTAEVEDFANPIEPSSLGGAKIAAEIVKVVRTHPFESLAQP